MIKLSTPFYNSLRRVTNRAVTQSSGVIHKGLVNNYFCTNQSRLHPITPSHSNESFHLPLPEGNTQFINKLDLKLTSEREKVRSAIKLMTARTKAAEETQFATPEEKKKFQDMLEGRLNFREFASGVLAQEGPRECS